MSAGCGGGSHSETPVTPPVNPPTANSVAIVSCKSYNTDLQSALSHGAELLGGLSPLVNGKTVTVKVNLTSDGTFEHQFGMLPGESFITDGRTAIALARLLLAKGARKVRFVDSAAFRLPLDQVLALAQWDVATLLSLGNVEVENTRNLGNGSAYARLDVPNGGYMFNYFQLNHSYQDTDVFVSMAKMKQHQLAGVTLSMKCLFGCTPNSLYGTEAGSEDAIGYRGTLHGDYAPPIPPPGMRTDVNITGAGARIPRIVADLNAARPVHLAIVDGITSMSGGEGPWAPNAAPIAPGVIVMGLNAVSTDAVAMAVMGYDNPRATRGTRPFQTCDNHLLLAEQAGVGTADLTKIDVRGLTIQQARFPYPG
jgi:uncharacterized protein (DUF362 family)